ncbi:MAG: RDD family protein [Frankia sp.]|nr:RDD family protein [Frankia sp.]
MARGRSPPAGYPGFPGTVFTVARRPSIRRQRREQLDRPPVSTATVAPAVGQPAGPRGSQLVTGEAVAVDLRPARLGSRMIAALVDLIIQFVTLWFAMVGALLIVRPQDPALEVAVVLIVYVAVMLGYPVVMETFAQGRTLGKMLMQLRVVRDDGGPIRFRHALVRGLLGIVVERPGILFGAVGVIAMMVSRRSKRLGDLFAGTVVLHESVPMTRGMVPVVAPPLAGWVRQLDLTGLDDQLAGSARQFLGRVHELAPNARERIGADLVARFQAVVTPPPPPGTPGWAYLSAVLAERTRRSYARLVVVSRSRYTPADLGIPAKYLPPEQRAAAEAAEAARAFAQQRRPARR